jgi:hypothetical protein
MRPPIVTESVAQKAARKPGTWKPGWYPSRIETAREYVSPGGNDCFELGHAVRNAAGDVRNMRDYLVAVESRLLKLKHAIEAVGASDKYNAGEEITQDDFPGHDVEVQLAIEKKGGFTRNVIQDYRPVSAAPLVNLRAAG